MIDQDLLIYKVKGVQPTRIIRTYFDFSLYFLDENKRQYSFGTSDQKDNTITE